MLNKLIKSLNTGIIQLDAGGLIQEYNPAVEKLLGVKPENQQKFSDYTNSIRAVLVNGEALNESDSFGKLLNTKQSIIVNLPGIEGDNDKWINVRLLNEDSAEAESESDSFIILEDISDEKLLDELSDRIDKYETAHKKIHMGVWEHEVSTENVYWSEEIYKLFYRDIELGPPNYSEFTFLIHPEDRYYVDEHFQRSLIEGVSCNLDYRTNPTIGPMRYLNTQCSCIMSNNQVVKIYGTNLDVTDRALATNALKKREAELSLAAEIIKIGYWEYDVASDMFTFSDSFYNIFGTTVIKMGGYKMSSSRYSDLFIPPEDAMIVGNEALKGLNAKEPNYSKVINHGIVYSDGSIGMVEAHLFFVKDKDGKTIKAYGVIRDVTNEQTR